MKIICIQVWNWWSM